MPADGRIKKRRIAFARNIALSLLVAVAAPFVFDYFKNFLTTDPFKRIFGPSKGDLTSEIGMYMSDVRIRDYTGGKLVSSAMAKRMDVRKDRQGFILYGVTNGVYNGDHGKFNYSARTAIWNLTVKQVFVNDGGEVHNKDMDLKAQGLVYNDRTAVMNVSGDVTGRLYKGIVNASAVLYNFKTGAAEAGPVEWQGTIDQGELNEIQGAAQQDDQKVTPKKWDIKGAKMKSLGSDSDTYLYEDATAKDDELIIQAPIVEQNRKTDVLTAEGGIHYYSAKADIVADKCVVYRKEKRTVLTGHVIMYVKPKSKENDPPQIEKMPDFKPVAPAQVVVKSPDKALDKDQEKTREDEVRSSKNLRDFPMVVVSDKTEYWYGKGERHAIITGDPQGRQTMQGEEWRHLWSHVAYYNGETDKLQMVSTDGKRDVEVKTSLGDDVHFKDCTVSTKEDDNSIDGSDIDGSLYSASDEVPKDDKSKTGTPPPTKTGGSGPPGKG